MVSVEQLPHSGFDAAGGAGHKAFIELQYAKPDPTLHTQLFAKFPWDYFESDTGRQYRMQISTYGDMDSAELLTSICCEHLPRGGCWHRVRKPREVPVPDPEALLRGHQPGHHELRAHRGAHRFRPAWQAPRPPTSLAVGRGSC